MLTNLINQVAYFHVNYMVNSTTNLAYIFVKDYIPSNMAASVVAILN